jgi:hypothetical protein
MHGNISLTALLQLPELSDGSNNPKKPSEFQQNSKHHKASEQ